MNKVTSEKPITSFSEFVIATEILLMQINDLPGIRFRQLLRLTGLSNGVLEFHLKILENLSQIRVVRQSENIVLYRFNYQFRKIVETGGLHLLDIKVPIFNSGVDFERM